MISGKTSDVQNLLGELNVEPSMSGTISGESTLTGKVSVSVRDIPYYETANLSGGTTVYIGKEIAKNGS